MPSLFGIECVGNGFSCYSYFLLHAFDVTSSNATNARQERIIRRRFDVGTSCSFVYRTPSVSRVRHV